MKKVTRPFDRIVFPKTFSAMYNMHKYWGKKPASVLKEYINYYTNKDDVVFDPFSGYGVTAMESVLSNRKAIAVDLNPASKYILNGVLGDAGPAEVIKEFEMLANEVGPDIRHLYKTICPNCGATTEFSSMVYENDTPVSVKLRCAQCHFRGEKPVDDNDLSLIKRINGIEITKWYPHLSVFQGWETRKINKKGISRYEDLFTHRNMLALSIIFDRICRIDNASARTSFVITFTSMVAQASKMIADYRNNSGGPSWKLNSYWLPGRNQELNVWQYFTNRVRKTISGKREISQRVKSSSLSLTNQYQFILSDSTDLTKSIDSGVADYIFTDPPYGGEGIQYMELSFLWNAWLTRFDEKIDWQREVAYNPFRKVKLTNKDYENRLTEVFSECHRILKKNGWMTLTFANKDTDIWNILIRALNNSGFQLRNIIPLTPSASNLTQHLLKDTSKTDLIINLKRVSDTDKMHQTALNLFSLNEELENILHEGLSTSSSVSLNQVFDSLIISWMTNTYSSPISHNQKASADFDKSSVERMLNNRSDLTQLKPRNQGDIANPRWQWQS